jgi:hypothetical protein
MTLLMVHTVQDSFKNIPIVFLHRVVKKRQFMMRFCPSGPQMPMILYGNIEWLLNVIMSVIIYIIGWI